MAGPVSTPNSSTAFIFVVIRRALECLGVSGIESSMP